MKRKYLSLSTLWMLLSFCIQAQAYSYSAAGSEPLIDGRDTLLSAANSGDFVAATEAYKKFQDDFLYFETEYGIDLDTPMQNALKARNVEQVLQALNQAYSVEINRRLTGAVDNISDYQVAKVLVVKSKLFLDLLTPQMNTDDRQQAEKAIQGALQAIGNPGVFGVGAAPADPEALTRYHKQLLNTLKAFSF